MRASWCSGAIAARAAQVRLPAVPSAFLTSIIVIASLIPGGSDQSASTYDLAYPAPVNLVMGQMSTSCPKASPNADFTGRDLITITDLNGDGIYDFVVSEQKFSCFRWGNGDTAVGIQKCKRNCRAWLIVSSGRGNYRVAWIGRAFNIVRSGHNTMAAETRRGCRSMKCTFSLIWQDGAVVRKPGIR